MIAFAGLRWQGLPCRVLLLAIMAPLICRASTEQPQAFSIDQSPTRYIRPARYKRTTLIDAVERKMGKMTERRQRAIIDEWLEWSGICRGIERCLRVINRPDLALNGA